MLFEEALVLELSTIPELSSKVFPLVAPQETSVPLLVYELNDSNRQMTIQGMIGLLTSQYELTVRHTTYSSLKSLSKLITDKLKTFQSRTIATSGPFIMSIEILNQYEGFDDVTKTFFMQLDIEITFQEN